MTAASALPKRACRMSLLPGMQTATSPKETSVVTVKSCLAAAFALGWSSRPRYWDATIEPPVESAAKTLSSSRLIESTSETPETAASPTLDTMKVSAMPTVAASTCSMISGMISRTKSLLVNISKPHLLIICNHSAPCA